MQSQSNDCLGFSVSPHSTNYTFNEMEQEGTQYEEKLELFKDTCDSDCVIDVECVSIEFEHNEELSK